MSVELQTAVKLSPVRRPKRTRPETAIIFATVTRTERIFPGIQRITFQSAEFDGFITAVPDQFITFIFPDGDRRQPAVSRSFEWEDYFKLEESARPHARNYTVRAYRRDLLEIDVDMILHADDGIGTKWARTTEPGDQLAIWGPRMAFDPPPNAAWFLLVGDEVALPAIASILENLPYSAAARVIVETDGEFDSYPLISEAQVEISRIDHDGKQGDALIDAVRRVSLPDAVAYAWGGGELRTMQTVGRILRRELGMRAIDVSTIGYW